MWSASFAAMAMGAKLDEFQKFSDRVQADQRARIIPVMVVQGAPQLHDLIELDDQSSDESLTDDSVFSDGDEKIEEDMLPPQYVAHGEVNDTKA